MANRSTRFLQKWLSYQFVPQPVFKQTAGAQTGHAVELYPPYQPAHNFFQLMPEHRLLPISLIIQTGNSELKTRVHAFTGTVVPENLWQEKQCVPQRVFRRNIQPTSFPVINTGVNWKRSARFSVHRYLYKRVLLLMQAVWNWSSVITSPNGGMLP